MDSAADIMIVEDEALIACDLRTAVEEGTGKTPVVVAATRDARRMMEFHNFGFVFLDIDVLDGKTFDLARELRRRGVEFVFISASRQADLPKDLQTAPFLSKPWRYDDVDRILLTLC